jgi:hypothetical protein
VDRLTPDCKTAAGCSIPALDRDGLRILELRALIIRLRDLVDSGTVLTLAEAELEDLVLLAMVEDELSGQEKRQKQRRGSE